MTTLCGHERDALIWALRLAYAMPRSAQASYRPPNPMPDELARIQAVDDIHDPAKLAEMLAARGRELGLSIAIYDNHRRFRMSGAPVVYALLIVASGFSIMDRDKRGWDFDMLQARAILLQWLQLPDCAREEAEKALRGET